MSKHTFTIRLFRARQGRTLAVIHTQQGNLVRWQRIVLPVSLESVQATQLVLAGALRQLEKQWPHDVEAQELLGQGAAPAGAEVADKTCAQHAQQHGAGGRKAGGK
ncbi:MAG: hypothetical protein AUJ49_04910 [Desulfovibrionaceae bacterium CG1_02_65_16]|nr:MAG: hypothetical protein AUJ49_04910 [Desulfovibrionaceae bacterium CG1_02_65_16]